MNNALAILDASRGTPLLLAETCTLVLQPPRARPHMRTPQAPQHPARVRRRLARLLRLLRALRIGRASGRAANGRALRRAARRNAARRHDPPPSGRDLPRACTRRNSSPTADPHVRAVLQGVARTCGSAPRRKDALTVERLKDALWRLDDGLKGARDRALLLLAFAGGFRRSEIAALDCEDLHFEERGLVVTLKPLEDRSARRGAGGADPVPAHGRAVSGARRARVDRRRRDRRRAALPHLQFATRATRGKRAPHGAADRRPRPRAPGAARCAARGDRRGLRRPQFAGGIRHLRRSARGCPKRACRP